MTDQESALFLNKDLILLDELLRARSQEIHQRKPNNHQQENPNSPCLNRFMDFRLKSGSPKNRVSPASAAMRKIYEAPEVEHRVKLLELCRDAGV